MMNVPNLMGMRKTNYFDIYPNNKYKYKLYNIKLLYFYFTP